jgi:hypothetical protein
MALGSAQLYLQHVWKLHGLPKSMISNHGLEFATEFMHKLYCLLLSGYQHPQPITPQLDSQTKCVYQELKQYI